VIITRGSNANGKPAPPSSEATRTLKYVGEGWFPANPKVLRDMWQGVKEKRFKTNEEFIEAIRQDFSLFGYCLRQIARNTRRDNLKWELVEALDKIPTAELLRILPTNEKQISSHEMHESSPEQRESIQHFFISASTVALLAKSANVDGLTAVCAEFFRQVGYALISWNYPRIYAKAVLNQPNDWEALDKTLQKIVGASPRDIGLELARSWHAGPVLLDIIGSTAAAGGPKEINDRTPEEEIIKQFCLIGETLAKTANPEHDDMFQGASEWAVAAVKEIAGEKGLAELSETIDEQWNGYIQALSEPASDSTENPQTTHIFTNEFMEECPTSVRNALGNCYELMSPGKASAQALRQLVEFTIIECGFTKGCIYLVDPKELRMLPHIVIGNASKDNFRPGYLQSIGTRNDPLTTAYITLNSVRGFSYFASAKTLAYIAAPLGISEKRGVFYLETASEELLNDEQKLGVTYHAVLQAIGHALNIKLDIRSSGSPGKRKFDYNFAGKGYGL
jgi:hypothetical protein